MVELVTWSLSKIQALLINNSPATHILGSWNAGVLAYWIDTYHSLSLLQQLTFKRVARGMLHTDRLVLAVLLARIRLRGVTAEPSYDTEFQFLLKSKEGLLNSTLSAIPGLTPEQTDSMLRLSNKYDILYTLAQQFDFIRFLVLILFCKC